MINIDDFVSKHVTKRDKSMFLSDLENNRNQLKEKIEGKSVLVIGGAGSIGSSFIKALIPFRPKSLVVVDINENGLAELTRDLRSTKEMFIPDEYITYPINYADPIFYSLFRKSFGFDIVANFSAHKHVRSEKDIFSIEALIRNNIINAKKLLDLLEEFPPKHFFCVSTDKAANPVNIMGGSKKIMEELIISYSQKFPVTTARFANVAFSNGSLPDGFTKRILKLQPISAPTDVKRYFVSKEESGHICLLACFLGTNGEIFFPKLNNVHEITFSEIAIKFLSELGYTVEECKSENEAINKSGELIRKTNKYPVYFSKSNTTGEKPFEEFYTTEEQIDKERFKSLGVITNAKVRKRSELDNLIIKFNDSFENKNVTKEEIITIFKQYLGHFEHIETGKNLDSKM